MVGIILQLVADHKNGVMASIIFLSFLKCVCLFLIQLSKIKQALDTKCKLKRLVSNDQRPIAKLPQPILLIFLLSIPLKLKSKNTYKLINKKLMSDSINLNEDLLSHSIFEICIFPWLFIQFISKIPNHFCNQLSVGTLQCCFPIAFATSNRLQAPSTSDLVLQRKLKRLEQSIASNLKKLF